jgi:hypothetical protein
MYNKIKLYLNTIKYLKISQIFYRLSNRFKRELFKREILSVTIPNELKVMNDLNYIIPELDFNKDYLDRFEIEYIYRDKFTFINLTNEVDLSEAWNNKDLQHLWRYNLHYFEYLFKLANEYSKDNTQIKYYKKYKELIRNWIENNSFAYGDGWHPYTISLRITNWISTYEVFKEKIKHDHDFDRVFRESIYLQYKYLQINLEKDVLGNHYFENIKALLIGSIFFNDIKVKNRFKKELLKQLEEQILEDGMHFELSPMYHKIILENLIKISYWLRDEKIYKNLIIYIQKMINVTFSFEENFGKTPAFNDSADGVSKDFKCLLEVCNKYFGLNPQSNTNFNNSGFYIIEDRYKKLIFDTGDICPTYLPAHGHCDALSFELSINGLPLIVNSGTYQYESGKWRNHFRSTKTHNTVTISEHEQSEIWGSFRVAKRIKKIRRKQFIYKNIEFYVGSFVSYKGEEHKRYIGYLDDDTIIVLDYVNAKSKDKVQSYLHFVPEANLYIKNNTVHAAKNNQSIEITPIGISSINIAKGWYSEQFNSKKENRHLVFQKDDNTKFFGYLMNFNSKKNELIVTENGLKLVENKELIINFNELGDML